MRLVYGFVPQSFPQQYLIFVLYNLIMVENTSFIPKKSEIPDVNKKESLDLLLLIAMVVFLVSLFSAVGVFLYKNFLTNTIEQNSINLEREKGNFDIASIEEFVRLDRRLNLSEDLLNNHVDLTSLFKLLEVNTLKNVQFQDFDFDSNEDSLDIAAKGIAKDYSTVALQSDIFGENQYIHNPIFSDLNVNEDGNIVFKLTASIDKDLILYRSNIE